MARLKLKVEKSATKRIVTYNNNSVPVIGQVKAQCEAKNNSSEVIFKIVPDNLSPILGRKMCEQMGFIMRVDQMESSSEATDKLGCCKNFEYEIDFVDDPKFKIIPPRRIAHALRDKVKAELQKMTEMSVICPVTEPTPAVSPIVVVNEGDKIPGPYRGGC